ncbi:hypothetical protein [Streptomyces arenae]|nr:hypothetical protein [Streptomyces arenae]MCG7206645.1 hypothetical protein [Streptomyces arenae]
MSATRHHETQSRGALCTLLALVSATLAAGTAPDTAWLLALRTVTRTAAR